MLAISNPLGNLPVFLSATTEERPRVRNILAIYVNVAVFVLLLFFFISGEWLLNFFGISIPAFRIAGGILLLINGIGMIRSDGSGKTDRLEKLVGGDDFQEADTTFRSIAVPVVCPLIVGPGSISTVILFSEQATRLGTTLMMGLMLLCYAGISAFVFTVGQKAIDYVGTLGIDLATRLFGLALAAIGVQFILQGMHGVFPEVMMDPSLAIPGKH
jgi:MarC family membrane protein